MGLILLIQTTIVCLITGTIYGRFWFSYILFIIIIILSLEEYGEVKICWSCRDSNSRTVHPVATDYDIPAPASLPTETSKYVYKIQQVQPVGNWSGRNSSRYIYIPTHAQVLWRSESATRSCTLCFPPWGQNRLLASFHMLRSNKCAVFFHPYHHD